MKHPAVPVSDQVVPGRPARALVGLSVRQPGRHGQARRASRPARARHGQARVLSHAHGPVAVVPTAR